MSSFDDELHGYKIVVALLAICLIEDLEFVSLSIVCHAGRIFPAVSVLHTHTHGNRSRTAARHFYARRDKIIKRIFAVSAYIASAIAPSGRPLSHPETTLVSSSRVTSGSGKAERFSSIVKRYAAINGRAVAPNYRDASEPRVG